MNEELENIKRYCATNKLSLNLKKTNYMIKTSKKKFFPDIRIGSIERKD